MATNAQINANRTNAQKSTGPRTAEGKAKIAQNATKHGLTSSATLITGEDPADYQLHREALLADLAPQGALQLLFAERIVSLSWRLNRAVRIQDATMDAMIERTAANPYSKLPEKLCEMTPEDANTAIGRSTAGYSENSKTLDRLLLYERRIEQSLYKALHQLQSLQRSPRPQPPSFRNPQNTIEQSEPIRSTAAHNVIPSAVEESIVNIVPHRPHPAPAARHVIPSPSEESTENPKSPQATCLTHSLRPACSAPHNPDISAQHLKKQTQSIREAPAGPHHTT